MSVAKMGLNVYVFRNPFAKLDKISTNDEDFLVATLSKIRQSFKHIRKTQPLAFGKLNAILQPYLQNQNLNTNITSSKTLFKINNQPLSNSSATSHILDTKQSLPNASQKPPSNNWLKQSSHTLFAPQLALPFLRSKLAVRIKPKNRSLSISKISANILQNSDTKEGEQFEHLGPISTIFDTKSTNHNLIPQLSAKSTNVNYKYITKKFFSLFTQNSVTIISVTIIQNRASLYKIKNTTRKIE